MSSTPESCWTAVANIVRERPFGPGGTETRRGTKHFAPGAKVHIIDWYAGMCERIIVVGQHRRTKHFSTLVIDVKLVENLRAKVCYQPAVIAKIKEHYAQAYAPKELGHLNQDFAEQICATIPHWQAQSGPPPPPAPVSLAATLQPASNSLLARLRLQLSFWLKN